MRMPKFVALFAALLLCVFMASTAMAISVTNRSAEMDDFSTCDRAGTIQMTFTQNDWNLLTTFLLTNDYALIRIALNGDNLPASPTLPVLCEDIHGTSVNALVPHSGELVTLDDIDVEISNVTGTAAGPDLTMYVHGDSGAQFIEVYITALQADAGIDWVNEPPWFKIGLYQELIADTDDSTAICADVRSFSGISRLTISNEATPNSITFSGDNEIGHFLTKTTSLSECSKGEQGDVDGEGGTCSNDTTIQLCPLAEQGCEYYHKCFVITGDLPASEDVEITVRSDQDSGGTTTQAGVYIDDISVYNENTDADITPTWAWNGAAPCDSWTRTVGTADDLASTTNGFRFCVTYAVNPAEAVPDTNVRFWVYINKLPCGVLYSGMVTAAELQSCAPGGRSMYFPYVLTQHSTWQCGIVITNLSSTITAANMEATLTLTDSTGAVFTYTKTDFTQVVWATMTDSIVSNFSGTPAPGAAWLKVDTNFSVDGYEFMTDGNFGAGTLPRIIEGNGWQ